MVGSFICLLILFMAVAVHGAAGRYLPEMLSGQTFIHDPSSIVTDKGVLRFGIEPDIRIKSSPDLTDSHKLRKASLTPAIWTNAISKPATSATKSASTLRFIKRRETR